MSTPQDREDAYLDAALAAGWTLAQAAHLLSLREDVATIGEEPPPDAEDSQALLPTEPACSAPWAVAA